MLISVPNSDCTNAREAVSARLDGELSELEALRLDVHLRACAACRSYSQEVERITLSLRAASSDQPRIRIELPVRRRHVPVRSAAAAVALVAAVGSSFALGRSLDSGGRPAKAVTAAEVRTTSAVAPSEQLLAMLDRFAPQAPQHRGKLQAI
ncbi:MAG: putative zinc-finger [Gaiellaceae bacterium]|nr:putative zinc-finger [Gaiellaceae bacterium]